MINGIHHVGICVPDLEISRNWYCEMMEAEVITDFIVEDQSLGNAVALPGARLHGSMLRWSKGGINTMIELLQYDSPIPRQFDQSMRMCDYGITHVAFWTVNAINELYEKFKSKGVWFYSAPQVLKLPGQNVHMCYFKDNNGFSLELIGT
jgi:catechol 2,3-dioxygenase-like lactoylglutathione lyase family enzyme